MHTTAIPQDIVDRVTNTRGALHPHADFNPKTTALLVVDMQNCFVDKELASVYVPKAIEVIPNVNRLAEAIRNSGGKVFFVHNTADGDTTQTWSNWFGMLLGHPDKIQHHINNMSIGSPGYALHPDLIVKPADEAVCKHRFSAFIPGSSDLTERLRSQNIDTLIVVGTLTNVCCESSARDAMMLNFKIIMVSDACAAMTDAEHNAALLNMFTTFADIMTTDFVIDCLNKNQ